MKCFRVCVLFRIRCVRVLSSFWEMCGKGQIGLRKY